MYVRSAEMTKDNTETRVPTLVSLGPERLSVDEATAAVTHASCGAVSVFMGTTRDSFHGREVVRLDYEAYVPMAEREMHKICNEIRVKWNAVYGIVMQHRLGSVPVTEASVLIVVSSPHRADAMQAVTYGIDRLKTTVPVWKKEIFADGGQEWKANCEGCKKHRHAHK